MGQLHEERALEDDDKKNCTYFPVFITEPSLTDMATGNGTTPGDLFIWEENPLCEGTDVVDCADPVGKASGHGIVLGVMETFDSEDSWVLNDEYGSTLYSRGISQPGQTEAVVIGGTGCYEGATGSVFSEVMSGESGEYFNYDLSHVSVP